MKKINHYSNNLLNFSPPPTLKNKGYTNLFFQISPSNNRLDKINQINNIYYQYINKNERKENSYLPTNIPEFKRKKIVNEIHYIFDKVNFTSNNEQEVLFPTQLKRRKQRRLQRHDKANFSDNLHENYDSSKSDLPEVKKPIFDHKTIIVIGRGKNNKNDNSNNGERFKCNFKEIDGGIRNIMNDILEKNLENFQMKDQIEANRKPKFK